ncbi:MAG: outer membrane protein assembly factor BamD [Muribaculaceae bacterium]|nr:outer membrane protein assembly factor BamD [Muribaculaceae bacterium]MBQ7211403.1 outer membrane protein assembly factor BamD [Muribaculaceae bacterium]
MRRYLLFILAGLLLASCGEYQKVLKSSDNNYKFEYAKKAFDRRQYAQASTILADLVNIFKTNDKAEETLYLLALSYYENKDYVNSAAYFHNYYTRYPKGKYAELARYYCGYSYFIDSPEAQLDQSVTLKAIKELQSFIEYFPTSDKVAIAQAAIFEMQDKLTLKELQNAQLYYNLGTYMGNNYQSAIIVAQNAIKDYPYSKYKEELEMIVLKSRYQEAVQSVEEKKADRFREVVDEYYSFINNYPDGENRREADNIYKIASKYVKE